jgi:multiple sugar transport system permease protein
MYFPNDGLINTTLELLGYDGKAIPFLADYTYDGVPLSWLHDLGLFTWVESINLVTWSIIGAGIWRQIGYIMLIYLAGLKGVDTTLVEAARVDGAGPIRTFKDVVLPQLQPVTVIVVVISIIDALRSFDLVNLMTDGGPASRSTVLAHRMYEEAFNNYEMGFGASYAVVLSLLAACFIFPYLRYMVKNELEY